MSGEIFISYRRSDQAKAELLHRLLKERGVESWYDALLGAGEDWRTATAGALEKAPIFVLLFSQAASESTDIAKELAAATLEKKLVIPVRIENIRPKGAFLYELASRNWVDAYEDAEAKFAKLADDLAALVQGGPKAKAAAASLGARLEDRAGFKAARTSLLKQPAAVGALAMLVVVFAVGWFLVLQPKAHPANEAVAVFTFSASGDDPRLPALAATATKETFRLMRIMRIAAGLQPETGVTTDAEAVDRAAQMGARFVLTGSMERTSELLTSTARLIDIRTRAIIAERKREHAVDQSTLAAYAIAGDAGEIAACTWDRVASYAPAFPDPEITSLVGKVCSMSSDMSELSPMLMAERELARRSPDNGHVQAYMALDFSFSVAMTPEAMRDGLWKDARAALAAAEKIAPHDYMTATARTLLAAAEGKLPVEWAPAFEREMQRAPDARDTYSYATAALAAGQTALLFGRTKEAARYFEIANGGNPAQTVGPYFYAIARAGSGQYGADKVLLDNVGKRMNSYSWEVALAAAIFLKAADPELVFAATTPDNVIAAACYREVVKALSLKDKRRRLEAAKRVDRCLSEFNSPHTNIMAQSMLGDVDRAFELVDRPDIATLGFAYFPTMFLPPARSLRADPRFLPLMEKAGFIDYWKTTKTRPDICETPEEKGIPLCRALAG